MERKDWLALCAVHSDAWLMALAFFYAARFADDGRWACAGSGVCGWCQRPPGQPHAKLAAWPGGSWAHRPSLAAPWLAARAADPHYPPTHLLTGAHCPLCDLAGRSCSRSSTSTPPCTRWSPAAWRATSCTKRSRRWCRCGCVFYGGALCGVYVGWWRNGRAGVRNCSYGAAKPCVQDACLHSQRRQQLRAAALWQPWGRFLGCFLRSQRTRCAPHTRHRAAALQGRSQQAQQYPPQQPQFAQAGRQVCGPEAADEAAWLGRVGLGRQSRGLRGDWLQHEPCSAGVAGCAAVLSVHSIGREHRVGCSSVLAARQRPKLGFAWIAVCRCKQQTRRCQRGGSSHTQTSHRRCRGGKQR